MTVERERRAAFLEEMGLGPAWVRRHTPPAAAESAKESVLPSAVAEAPAPVHSAPAPIPESAAPAAFEHTRAASDAFAPLDDMPVFQLDTEPAPAREAPATAIVSRIAAMDWNELEQTVSSCTRCGLCNGRTKTVFGVGDRKANWLFVGEGPGREEDLRGEPFVGRAGQLLDNMLAAMQLARGQNAYIANIVKCRPTDEAGKDRRPSADETAACMPYLLRQIELIQPSVIIALGKTAAVSLLGVDPETPVAGLRGKVHRYAERPLIVTYHPAYLLRAPADKKKTWADLCLAMGEFAKAD